MIFIVIRSREMPVTPTQKSNLLVTEYKFVLNSQALSFFGDGNLLGKSV